MAVPLGATVGNLYLDGVDRMLERAKEVTSQRQVHVLEYVRFADDLVVLVDAYRRHEWLVTAAHRRLREELGKLQVSMNEQKSRIVDLAKGEASDSWSSISVGCGLSRLERGAPQYTPK
jgi:RNA-directed DNA polymerase